MTRTAWEDDTLDMPAVVPNELTWWEKASFWFIVVCVISAFVAGCWPRETATALGATPPKPRPIVSRVTVKGTPADRHQREMITRVLDVGRRLHASRKANIAAIETITVESEAQNLPYGHLDSLGLFQQRPSQGWGTPAQVMNPEYASRSFYTRAIKLDRRWPGLSTGRLAQMVQRSAHPERYQIWAREARHTYIRYLLVR